MEKKIFIHAIFLIICFFVITSVARAQKDDEVTTREIKSLDFQKQRPAEVAKAGVSGTLPPKTTPIQKKKLAVITGKNRRYNLVKRIPPKKNEARDKQIPYKNVLKDEQLGVTFWRLRPIKPDDGDAPTFFVRIGDRRENWTAERVNSTTRFKPGDRVRFTIESSRSGFMYIVNREFYKDGTAGAASLIFPVSRINGGENRVTAGTLIEIPSASDSTPFFTIKPHRDGYAGEELIVLITKEKLPLEIGLKPLEINQTQLEKWLEDWGATIDIFDAADGEGIALTAAEASAGAQTRSLVQEEPLPQTIFKARINPDAPLLVSFRMSAVP